MEVIKERCRQYFEATGATPNIRNLLVYVHSCSNDDNYNGDIDRREATLFTGFRWTSAYHPLFNLNKENWVGKEANPKLMTLLFQNSNLFYASAVLPDDLETATYMDFNLFDPAGGSNFGEGMPGNYVSDAPLVEGYYEHIIRITKIEDRYTRDIVMLGLLYDFMANVSVRFRRPIQSRKILRADRACLQSEILQVSTKREFQGVSPDHPHIPSHHGVYSSTQEQIQVPSHTTNEGIARYETTTTSPR